MKKNELLSNIIWFVGMLAVLFAVRHFIVSPIQVSGDSMLPTLENKERIMQLKFGEPERFEIVTFPAPDQPGKSYIKRVIGVPGDEISFKNDQLYVNGEMVEEKYLSEVKKDYDTTNPYTSYKKPIDASTYELKTDFSLKDIEGIDTTVVPEGKVFVLGDNRPISKDSRYIGLIDIKDISGRVKFIFWPLDRFGLIEN
ncbi:signal peptidase I [Vagococcus zengguangii]|uniref:Signal peptidase I n=1 Tax=Vagococcus zengguangii TaxID=2571750 RepID=A0A4D7CT68_9ENTE|nr:signal peptidase I [Vagococcus zengguangii]QCI86224.1 signal peptidase I [Vagococcus zengguangii]